MRIRIKDLNLLFMKKWFTITTFVADNMRPYGQLKGLET
jgi:hypothetical protein